MVQYKGGNFSCVAHPGCIFEQGPTWKSKADHATRTHCPKRRGWLPFLALEEVGSTDGESKCFFLLVFWCALTCFLLGSGWDHRAQKFLTVLMTWGCLVFIQTRRAKSLLGLCVRVCTVVGRLAEGLQSWKLHDLGAIPTSSIDAALA